MEEYQLRVVDEKYDLDQKLNKLNDFLYSSPFHSSLDHEQQDLLCSQYYAMKHYSDILGKRIEFFEV